MKPPRNKPALFVRKASELALSGMALAVLLKAVLQQGVPFRFRAKGNSMSPLIKDGDVITVSPMAGRLPRLGHVVAYLHPETGHPVVHRIIAKMGTGYRLQGDGAYFSDGLVSKTAMVGFVDKIERDGERKVLGLGPERVVIAILLRFNVISRFLYPFWKILRTYIKRVPV